MPNDPSLYPNESSEFNDLYRFLFENRKKKIHISQIKAYVASKDEFWDIYQNQDRFQNLGEFEYGTGWFYLNVENQREIPMAEKITEAVKLVWKKLAVSIIFTILGMYFSSRYNLNEVLFSYNQQLATETMIGASVATFFYFIAFMYALLTIYSLSENILENNKNAKVWRMGWL